MFGKSGKLKILDDFRKPNYINNLEILQILSFPNESKYLEEILEILQKMMYKYIDFL
jgi:hypothetical protein